MSEQAIEFKCPHCGWTYNPVGADHLVPYHDFPKPCRSVCPGSKQSPRGLADKRPLWKDEKLDTIATTFQKVMNSQEPGLVEIKQMNISDREWSYVQDRYQGVIESDLSFDQKVGYLAAAFSSNEKLNSRLTLREIVDGLSERLASIRTPQGEAISYEAVQEVETTTDF